MALPPIISTSRAFGADTYGVCPKEGMGIISTTVLA